MSPSVENTLVSRRPATAPAAAGGRVLVIDDDPQICDLLAALLESDGHTVTSAAGAREGLSVAAREPFDIAVVDYEMPGRDGLRVLSELRELQPFCYRILCSGNLNVPLIMAAVNSGEISRVLTKPIDRSDLLTLVSDSLASRRRRLDGSESSGFEQRRIQLLECLRGEYVGMALQPICLANGPVAAFEGLMRSTHPTLDSPVAILRAAEEQSQFGLLADRVADLAAQKLEDMAGDWKLFINAHPKELTEPKLLEERIRRLSPWKERLVVEITERTYLLELSDWADSVRILSDAGFELAVDDLGAGYNSLIVLATLQPQYLKVDMSMTRDVDKDPRKQRLIEMLVRFAESTEAFVIAEGIETPEEADALLDCGVHLMQGYYFGRPSTDLDQARSQLRAKALPLR